MIEFFLLYCLLTVISQAILNTRKRNKKQYQDNYTTHKPFRCISFLFFLCDNKKKRRKEIMKCLLSKFKKATIVFFYWQSALLSREKKDDINESDFKKRIFVINQIWNVTMDVIDRLLSVIKSGASACVHWQRDRKKFASFIFFPPLSKQIIDQITISTVKRKPSVRYRWLYRSM